MSWDLLEPYFLSTYRRRYHCREKQYRYATQKQSRTLEYVPNYVFSPDFSFLGADERYDDDLDEEYVDHQDHQHQQQNVSASVDEFLSRVAADMPASGEAASEVEQVG